MSAVHPFLALLPLVAQTGTDRDLIAFILRNTPGANVDPDDIRTVQAAMAWWRKFGGEQSFEAYLDPIPQAPDFVALRTEFPQLDLPTLVDARLGYVKSAKLAGLKYAEYGYNDGTLVPFDVGRAISIKEPYWVLAHDGTPNLNRPPPDCRDECVDRLLPGTAEVLIAIWLQYGPRKHVMDGPGSVRAVDRGRCACVHPWSDGPCLIARRYQNALPKYGSVTFVRG